MKKGTVLIVEDEIDLQDVIKDIMSDVAETVLIANNGQEAIEVCRNNKVDAVLSDINMPVKNGLDFLKDLRALGYETPVVFLSGYGDKAKVTQALRLGALDFLDKPFEDHIVIDVMKRAIEYGNSLSEFEDTFKKIEAQMPLPEGDRIKLKEAKKKIWILRFERMYKQNAKS